MKVTEISVYPSNHEGNKVVEVNKMEGDFNLITPLLFSYIKKLDRQKLSYIYKIENAPANFYKFSLTNSEFESTLKLIPDLQTTW